MQPQDLQAQPTQETQPDMTVQPDLTVQPQLTVQPHLTVQPDQNLNSHQAHSEALLQHQPSENTQNLRSLLLKIMLGCVIAAAGVAVVAVLAGSMGDAGWRAVWTVFSAMIHTALLFGIVSTTATNNPLLVRSTNMVINTSMVVAMLSFFTSVMGIWGVMDGGLAARLYATYIVSLFLVLHGKSLMDIQVQFEKVRSYVRVNYLFMVIVACLILGVVYAPDGSSILSGFYGRLLAASAIVDVTLSIVVIGMYRLYIQKHPELEEKQKQRYEVAVTHGSKSFYYFYFSLPLLGQH
ncbi:hypothetical protein IPL68_01810 [Candidatus Saccharibacteria bacterium]|nr:MAG: hypothetical protein IPL68_01810 [Candidatus Saccharibacteria bacterium]